MDRQTPSHLISPSVLVCACLCAACGCTTVEFVELREKPVNPIIERLTHGAFGGPRPSERTQQFLVRTSYTQGNHFASILRHCQRVLARGPHRDALHAAAEVSHLAAVSAQNTDPALAMELYLDSTAYGWRFVTQPQHGGRISDPNSDENRATAEIYNTSLRELLRLLQSSGNYRMGQSVRMPITGRDLTVTVPFPSEWLSISQMGDFAFVSDYELRNLRNRHTTRGLGVPLIVRREKPSEGQPAAGYPAALEQYYANDLALPVTAVARFASAASGEQMHSSRHSASIELLDPRESDGILAAGHHLPLESDISTPLAWFLTDPRNSLLDTFSFLRPDRARKLEGLYMVQPYDPDRIPVLMVHGIWSSPITWMEMFNDLQADPVLSKRYQFWFYLYPTGEPLTFAAASLRERLREVRLHCDPHGQNPRLDQMVVVGHSMGGLMAYLMTVDSEDKLWNALSKVPVEELMTSEQARNEIRRVFFFEQDESIDRIVTIASPFSGSGYSNFFTQWLSGSLVSLPEATSTLTRLIFNQNNQSFWDRMFAPRTSVDSLNRHSAVLQLVSQTTPPDRVIHHNVVGISGGDSIDNWTDGVVRASSAIRKDADSETRVNASHSHVHRHPETIGEVRCILLSHLKALERTRTPIVPLRYQQPQQQPHRQQTKSHVR